MTAPPVNSDEDYYMDEPFDEESLSEVEEEQEQELQDDDALEESDSQSDSDVEAEFLRGNVSATNQDQPQELIIKQFSLNSLPPSLPQPHARRHQMYGKCSGGGSGFARESVMKYPSSSSEDEAQVVVSKTVAEVNQLSRNSDQTDDETPSVRTLIPKFNALAGFVKDDKIRDGETEDEEMEDDDEEVEDEVEDDLGEEEEIIEAHENDANDLIYEESDTEKDDVEIGQLEDDEDNEDDNEANESEDNEDEFQNDDIAKLKQPSQQDLVDIVDASESELGDNCSELEAEQCSPNLTDHEIEFYPMPKPPKRSHLPLSYTDLQREPIFPNGLHEQSIAVPAFPNPSGEDEDDDNVEIDTAEAINVKFLEQQMTQMSEMIMKTFRLSGGNADNSALEQLTMATKLMKKQSKKLAEMTQEDEFESISTIESSRTPNTVRSEKLTGNKCRCPSNTDVIDPNEEPFMMDECGQGDGLMRYPQSQSQRSRISCHVSSVTPSSFNSENCRNYHIDISRPRSSTSSEKVNYKNLGRKSFSFTNPQVREIERQNHILLKKMMNVKPTIKPATSTVKSISQLQAKKQPPPAPRMTSAAVNRKKYQRQIDLDNDMLKRKLEAVGSRRPLFK